MPKLEFFFDCSSPWTYLAFESLQNLHARHPSLDIDYRPILVGGVFNAINPTVYESRERPVPAKAAYLQKDLQDWAEFVGVTIGNPPVFPVNSAKAMRGVFMAIECGCVIAYVRQVFQRYWEELADISQEQELVPVAEKVGMNAGEFLERINAEDYRRLLRANTDELIERGGFGSPSIFINGGDMLFGNDRMPILESKLRSPA